MSLISLFFGNGLDSYYDSLTRESLQAQVRRDLLATKGSIFIQELRQARKTQNVLRRRFDKFATGVDGAGRKIWTQGSLASYLSHRFQNHPGISVELVRILWRCLCYNANYPFADLFAVSEHLSIDFDGWTQALAILCTYAARGVGWRHILDPYYGDKTPQTGCWHRFSSFAMHSHVERVPKKEIYDIPDMLQDITEVVACQLPISMTLVGPSLEEVRSRVEKLTFESHGSPNQLSIPYEDMLALLTAIMLLRKDQVPDAAWPDDVSPALSRDEDEVLAKTAATAVLTAAGIVEGTAVTFEAFFDLATLFRDDGMFPWSFDGEIISLWRALFCLQDHEPVQDPGEHVPTALLQVLDFMCPIRASLNAPRIRRQSTLRYRSSEDISSCAGPVLEALTQDYCPKILVIYGDLVAPEAAEAKAHRQALVIVLTSSPLWRKYLTGKEDDFLIDDDHLLLEISPQPRMLCYHGAGTKFREIVVTGDSHLSFGEAGADKEWPGLSIKYQTGLATLSTLSSSETAAEFGYKEIHVGHEKAAERPSRNQARETHLRMSKIEVYNQEAGVLVGLAVARVQDATQERETDHIVDEAKPGSVSKESSEGSHSIRSQE